MQAHADIDSVATNQKIEKQKFCKKTEKMSQSEGADELFEIRTALYIGNYQQCINEAQKLRVLFS